MRKHIIKLSLIPLWLMFSANSYAEGWDHQIGTYLLTINIDAVTGANTPGGAVETAIDMDLAMLPTT